jgi:hypothetical protein
MIGTGWNQLEGKTQKRPHEGCFARFGHRRSDLSGIDWVLQRCSGEAHFTEEVTMEHKSALALSRALSCVFLPPEVQKKPKIGAQPEFFKRRCDMKRLSVNFSVGLAFIVLFAFPAFAQQKPNILILWGDDIGYWNVSAYNQGMMGYKTPNIDRTRTRARSSPTGMASRAAPPAAPPLSPVNLRSAPDSPRLVCQGRRKACKRKTPRLPNCSNHSAMPPDNSGKTTLATGTIISRRFTALTYFSEIYTT